MTVNELIQLCKEEEISLDTNIYFCDHDGEHYFPTIWVMQEKTLSEEEIDCLSQEEILELPYICVGG